MRPMGARSRRTNLVGDLEPGLLAELAAAACSVRDQQVLAAEMAPPLGMVELDVIALVDFAAPEAASLYRAVTARLAGEQSLSNTPQRGVRLRVLLPGERRQVLSDELVRMLGEEPARGGGLVDHTIVAHPDNIAGLTLQPPALAARVGEALGRLLMLDSDSPLRTVFRSLGADENPDGRRNWWSAGFAAAACSREALLGRLSRGCRGFLRKRWLLRAWSREHAERAADRVLRGLIDSRLPSAEFCRRLARWQAAFFFPNAAGATPADLRATQVALVDGLAARSRRLAADLPNYRVMPPEPVDPRGWLKRLLNYLTGGWLFPWHCDWQPPPDTLADAAARWARLAALDEAVMNSQLAVARLLEKLSRPAESDPTGVGVPWPEEATARLTEKMEAMAQEGRLGDRDRVARGILSGADGLLEEFERAGLERLPINPRARGIAFAEQVAAALGWAEDWPRHMVRELLEQAAPWWGEPVAPDVQDYAFICAPTEEFLRAVRAADPGTRAVLQQEETVAVFRFLQGCVPQQVAACLKDGQKPRRGSLRTWIPAA